MIPYRQLRARIERDKKKKELRRAALREKYDDLEKAFTFRHYVKEARKCRKGVSFKLSVQNYYAKPFRTMETDCVSIRNGISPPISSSKKEEIRERGKVRVITPIKIRDRVNQRVLCDYALTPLISPRLIYDNGASMKGKGVSFARKRFNAMLEKAKALWGNDFYVLSYDFRKFFDTIPHRLCLEELDKTFQDKRIVSVAMQVIESYQTLDAMKAGDYGTVEMLARHEGQGVCLGSHVSQLMALCVPNFLDHYLKDVRGIQLSIRYMDDGIILHHSRNFLTALLRDMIQLCHSRGLELNKLKTHITPIRKGVMFLKARYRIVGLKTVKRLHRSSIVRMRRRLKRFDGLVYKGKMTLKMVWDSLQSWLGHTMHAAAFRQRKRMKALHHRLFGYSGEWGYLNA